jgi:tyrosyl-tRNA synthetase
MWRYYELLTDVRVDAITQMKADAASGKAHPMALKKKLAQSIVADFHSAEAAAKAAEDWAKLRPKELHKDGIPDGTAEVRVPLDEIRLHTEDAEDVRYSPDGVGFPPGFSAIGMAGRLHAIRLDRLLVKCGLADSVTDAVRKLKAASVKILDQSVKDVEYVEKSPRVNLIFQGSSARLVLRVGKKIKIAVIEQ